MEFQGTVPSAREYQNTTFAASALPTKICLFLASQAALAVLMLLPSGVVKSCCPDSPTQAQLWCSPNLMAEKPVLSTNEESVNCLQSPR